MYATTPLLVLTTMVAGTFANAIDTNGMFGLGEGLSIAGVVVRDVNGVERVVDYNKVAHLIPRQDACATMTVYSCGAATTPTIAPTPIISATPGGPIASTSAASVPTPASSETTAPASESTPVAATTAPSAPASSAPAASSTPTTIAGTTAVSSAAVSSTVASATETVASPTSASATTAAATTSALPAGNAASFVGTNMVAAMVIGFAVAAFV